MSKVITKWIAGNLWDNKFHVAKLTVRETAKLFIVVEASRVAKQLIGYGKQLDKSSLYDSRKEAIAAALSNAEQRRRRLLDDLSAVEGEIRHWKSLDLEKRE